MISRQMRWRRWTAALAAATITVGAGGFAVAIAIPSSDNPNAVVPMAPVRILDTRAGIGGASAPIGPDTSYKLVVAGTSGVPADATGVLLNVTAVNGTAASFLTVYPEGSPRPNTSNLNWDDGAPHPNLVSVAIGTNGAVNFYNSAGQVDLIVDLAGYFEAIEPAPAVRAASALTAEAIVPAGHDWFPGPFAFNTTDFAVGTDITHDAATAPETFVVNRGVYRVQYHVNTEDCCMSDGVFTVTLNGAPVNPVSAIYTGPFSGGVHSHTLIVDVATDASILQLVLSGSGFVMAPYTPNASQSFAAITIERIGDHP
jgi:hypothetical protein